MTVRVLAVRAGGPAPTPPPGIDATAYVRALLEDVVEVVSDVPGVVAAVACRAGHRAVAEAVVWPGTPVLDVPDDDLGALLALGAALRADEVTLVAGDAPDLPPMLLGKLARGLSGVAEAGVVPAQDGGLVALAVRLPVPPWLPSEVGLDRPDALEQLRTVAPDPRVLTVAPGWHRLRGPTDIARLDPRLEGWEATRALLAATPT